MPQLRHIVSAAVLAAACVPTAAQATVVPRQALLEGTTWNEFDQVNASTGTLTLDKTRSHEGAQSAKAVFNGGANGYSRGIFNTDWRDGDDVWYGASFYLPTGFKSAMQGQVDLLRWDNWTVDPTNTDRSGIVIYNSDKKARLMRQQLGVEQVAISPTFDLPEGRWFHLEVHQKLSKGTGAINEVFLDGVKIAGTTDRNTYGRGVTRMRTGIVAIDAARQSNALTMWFDRSTVSTSQVGPLGAPAPAPEPAPPADTTPPQTTLTSAPAGTTTARTASVSFTSNESGSSFSCKLDAGAWAACTSPKAFSDLTVGTHTVQVRAADAAGNVDPTPASATWEVKALETTGEVDKAKGAVTSASSAWSSGYAAQYANDGSKSTRWSSTAADNQWWQADLGSAQSVEAVSIDWEGAYASSYVIETSLDGTTWSTAAHGSATGAGTVTSRFALREARYVRVRAITRGTRYGVSFWEARILGPQE